MYDIAQLERAMREQGLGPTGVARKIGRDVKEATVRSVFRRRSGRPETVKLIADALGVSMKKITRVPKRKRAA